MRDRAEKHAMLSGAILGAVLGALMALLFQRWKRSHPAQGRKPIRVGQVVRLATAIAVLVRQIGELIA